MKDAVKRMFDRLHQYIDDRRTWRAFKKHTIATYGREGFTTLKYKGVPVDIDVKAESQLLFLNNDPDPEMSKSIDELMTALDQESSPALHPVANAQALKMDIINRRVGA